MSLQDQAPDLVGAEFAQWEIEELIGGGGFAWVYKGIDRVLERTVAIKLLKPIRLDRGGGYPEGAKERFLQEGRMTASLHSEHTIQIYNLGSQEVEGQEYLFMVMEYLNGVTLSDYIDARGPLSPLEVVIVMRQIARSLYEAHTHPEQAFVHRDLKTVNIMTHEKPGHRLLGEDLHIKVLDFGIGKAINTGTKFDMHLTEQGELNVSPWYAAPEQLDPDCEIVLEAGSSSDGSPSSAASLPSAPTSSSTTGEPGEEISEVERTPKGARVQMGASAPAPPSGASSGTAPMASEDPVSEGASETIEPTPTPEPAPSPRGARRPRRASGATDEPDSETKPRPGSGAQTPPELSESASGSRTTPKPSTPSPSPSARPEGKGETLAKDAPGASPSRPDEKTHEQEVEVEEGAGEGEAVFFPVD